jgi:N-methylhydantoinase A
VTDANLLLGYLAPESSLAGGVELDSDAAKRAVAKLGDSLGLGEIETAEGIVRIASQEMVRALRVVTVERGVDPRRFALMPFGGAGPMHAAAIAEQLGMTKIICPRACGVLSALGLTASDRRRDSGRTVMLKGNALTAERVAEEVNALIESAGEGMSGAEPRASYEMRYAGQAFELAVSGPTDPDPGELAEQFAAAHEERYGYRDPDGVVELVNVRLAMVEPGPQPTPRAADSGGLDQSARKARFGADWIEAKVLRGEPTAGLRANGPLVFELPEATLVLPPGWSAEVDEAGTIVATSQTDGSAHPA